MGGGLVLYRGLTLLLEPAVAPALRALGARGGTWRASWTGAGEEAAKAAGSVWIHAASLGEVGAARSWAEALIGAGYRAPLLLTTRTRTGLERARRELSGTVAARIAPQDAPRLLRSFFLSISPARLDLVETELWPNLILEARRRAVPVLFVSAAVTDRTARRLRALGVAGPRLLGEGVWVLAQSSRHAGRYRSLGVPPDRIDVVGDLKAPEPDPTPGGDPAGRSALILGSLRRGEERLAVELAHALASRPAAPTLIAAPRHPAGAARLRRLLGEGAVPFAERDEAARTRGPLRAWIDELTAARRGSVGLLTTHGELPEAYAHARLAVVGGSFRPFGGHSVLEAAARGCPVLIGPHHESIEAAVDALRSEHALEIAATPAAAVRGTLALLDDPALLAAMSAGAIRAARGASGAAGRALEAVRRWRLDP